MRNEDFEAFVARKTREAVDAALPPYVTVMDAHDPRAVAIGNDWSRALFDGPFYLSPLVPALPCGNLVFVQSRSGNTAARDPSTLGGGNTDKHLVYEGLSRVAADAVLAGAETVRGGRVILSVWHPELVALRRALGLARHPIQIVATLRGLDLDGGLMFNVPQVPVVILTVEACSRSMHDAISRRPWISTVVMAGPDDLRDAFAALRARGINRISAIGGRSVAAQLIDAGLVQDVYLTTAPQEGGEPDTPMYPRPLHAMVALTKHGTGPEAGVRFDHLVLSRHSASVAAR